MPMHMAEMHVPVDMDMNKVILFHKLLVCQYFLGPAASNNCFIIPEYMYNIRYFFDNMEIMGGYDCGLSCLVGVIDNANDIARRLRIKACRWFIKK
jgi:hypothetical protein